MDDNMAPELLERIRPKALPGMPWAKLENVPLSELAPISGLIMTSILVLFFLLRQYVLEQMFIPSYYPKTIARLKPRDQRSFINHHLSFFAKIFLLFLAIYPFIRIILGANFNTPAHSGSRTTLGDIMFIVTEIFTAMYLSELGYREGISYVAVLHHIGAAVMAQTAVVMNVRAHEYRCSAIELVLAWTWGAFDLLAEFWPHITMILYRVYPNDHKRLARAFISACYLTAFGTILETAIILWMYGALFHRWTLMLKILTPVLHCVFSAAQMWGTSRLWAMYKIQMTKLRAESDAEGGQIQRRGSVSEQGEDKADIAK